MNKSKSRSIILVVAIVVLIGGVIAAGFKLRSTKFIDDYTSDSIYELLTMVSKPYADHIDHVINDIRLLDDMMYSFNPNRVYRVNDSRPCLEFIMESTGADDILFLDTGCQYMDLEYRTGILDMTLDVVTLFDNNQPMVRFLNWQDGQNRYVVAIPVEEYVMDGRTCHAMAMIFKPERMNSIFDVPSFEDKGHYYVLDNRGLIIFTNDDEAEGGSNHLSQYRAKGIISDDQVKTFRDDFSNGRKGSHLIEKDGVEYFFTYVPEENKDMNLAMEVPADLARSSLMEFRVMVARSVIIVAIVLMSVLLMALALFFAAQRSRAVADKERQNALELESINKKLDSSIQKAEAANRAKSTFLSNMSHDIRTPMNAIIGYTKLASSNMDNKEKLKDYLGKIDQSSTHLLSLINDVLDMSRIESNKMTINEKRESLSDIINSIRNMVDANLSRKKHQLDIQINIQNDHIFCDRLRLNQILLNILSNSIKYTNDGGMVSLTLSQSDSSKPNCNSYKFVVEDNGIGMSEEYLKSIFIPFSREKNTTVSGIQGTGLGMTITKNLVDMMGGTIKVESKLGKGTTTTVIIDFKVDESTDSDAPAEDKTTYNLAGRKVLLVEDNELNREIATMILEESGMEVFTANDGTVAVEMMKKASPGDYDLVLMDIQMPQMNGYEATRQIRALKTKISTIPIIAMTANAFEEDRREAIASGMNEHISKPIDVDLMRKTISEVLG